jgi:hypothetical protein
MAYLGDIIYDWILAYIHQRTVEMKVISYGLLLLTAAMAGHFAMFRPGWLAWSGVVIALGLAWGYAVRPHEAGENEHHHG